VDHAPAGDHDPVAALLDPLEVPDRSVVGPRVLAVDLDRHHSPQAAEVGRSVDQRLVAAGEHRRGHLLAVPAGWRVLDGYIAGGEPHRTYAIDPTPK
jgi:hypothetical protein